MTSRRAGVNTEVLHIVPALKVLNSKIESWCPLCGSPPLTLHSSSNESDPVFNDSSSQVYFQGAPARITLEIYAALHTASVLLCSRQEVWAGLWVGNPKVLLLGLKSNVRKFCSLTLVCIQQTFKYRCSSARQVRGTTLHSSRIAKILIQKSRSSVLKTFSRFSSFQFWQKMEEIPASCL